jgi:hypothetical protein
MVERRPVTRRRLGRSLMAVGAASGGCLAPRFASAAVVQEGAPPSVESAWEASTRRIDGGGSISGQNSIYLGHYL